MLANKNFEVVGEADEGMAAIKCIQKTNPDIVLLDLSLPKMDGISVLKEIKRLAHRPKVLVLTMNDSDEKIAEGFDNGADGYCLKDAAGTELISAIEDVLKGKNFISPSIAGKVVTGFVQGRGSKEG